MTAVNPFAETAKPVEERVHLTKAYPDDVLAKHVLSAIRSALRDLEKTEGAELEAAAYKGDDLPGPQKFLEVASRGVDYGRPFKIHWTSSDLAGEWRNRLMIFSVPGHNTWNGRGEPQRWASAQYWLVDTLKREPSKNDKAMELLKDCTLKHSNNGTPLRKFMTDWIDHAYNYYTAYCGYR